MSGAGALVRENVAPDTIVVGCPATVLQAKNLLTEIGSKILKNQKVKIFI